MLPAHHFSQPRLLTMRRRFARACALSSLLTLTLPIVSGCDTLARTKDAVLSAVSDRVPQSVVESLDEASWNSIKPSLSLIEDAATISDLAELALPLTQAASARGAPTNRWRFYVAKAPEPNAFALPGGTIVVHSGLFRLSETGEELLGVLGHEVGHVVGRHGVEGTLVRAGASLALPLILGDVGAWTQIAVEQGLGLTLLKFSRDQEREADSMGVSLLEEARYPSLGLPRFFRGLQSLEASRGSDLPVFLQRSMALLSTHPMSAERAANLTSLVSKAGTTQLPPEQSTRYAQLRARVLGTLNDAERAKHDDVAKAFAQTATDTPK